MKKFLVFVFAAAVLSGLLLVFAKPLVLNIFGGHVHFPEKYVGQHLTMEDGKKFLVYRRLMISNENDAGSAPAVFKVRFQFKNLEELLAYSQSMEKIARHPGMETILAKKNINSKKA